MTVLEALKSKVEYPLKENFFLSVLTERGISPTEVFTTIMAKSKEFRLARADCWIAMVSAPHVVEGDYQVSLTDKSNFITLANAIYREYSEPEYGKAERPTVTLVENW